MADTSVDTEMASVDVEGCAPSNLRSLAEMAERKLLNDLEASLQQHARSATFACGGSVPFTKNTDSTGLESSADAVNRSVHQIYPVQIRFGENGKGIALTLPGAEASSKEFQELLSVCQPASFGRGGEDVLDEDYRKAGKLDRTAFATNFCPYEAGIVDVVAQLLLPQTAQGWHMRSIKACNGDPKRRTMLTFYLLFQRPNCTSLTSTALRVACSRLTWTPQEASPRSEV